jgi:hypothetical protein
LFKKGENKMYKAFAISLLCAGCALGQDPVPGVPVIKMGAPMGITTALAGPIATIAGAPYSAQAVTERVQILSDGNRIDQTTTSSVARDSQGRVRRDESLAGLTLKNGEAPPHIVMIEDPVAGVHWTLDAQTKTAMKMTIPAGKAGAFAFAGAMPNPGLARTKTSGDSGAMAGGGSAAGVTTASAVGPMLQVFSDGPESDANKTDLGTQTVEGVPAQGTRITRTIPAGQMGNQAPIVITTETWYSPDLKVLVMSKSTDPRMGDTTYTLSNIDRSEPAATLFQPPADYTVKDQPGPVFQEFKKED